MNPINLKTPTIYAFCSQHGKAIAALATLVALTAIATAISLHQGYFDFGSNVSSIAMYISIDLGAVAAISILYLYLRFQRFEPPKEKISEQPAPTLEPPPIPPIPKTELPPLPPLMPELPPLPPLPPVATLEIPPLILDPPPMPTPVPAKPLEPAAAAPEPNLEELPKPFLSPDQRANAIARLNQKLQVKLNEFEVLKQVAIPILNAVEQVMLEWLNSAYLSYHKKETPDLLERQRILIEIFAVQFKLLVTSLLTNNEHLIPKEIAFLTIFFPEFRRQDFSNLDPRAFLKGLISFLERFVKVLNEKNALTNRTSKNPDTAEIFDKGFKLLHNYNFSAAISLAKNFPGIPELEKAQGIAHLTAFQYPFYYAFTDSWFGMKIFKQQFKECALIHINDLLKKLNALDGKDFAPIVTAFQEGCAQFQTGLQQIRTNGK